MDNKKASDILGFYFIIYQSTLTNFIKCWIDGSEDYTFIDRDEFLGYIRKTNYSPNFLIEVIDSLTTTSIYFWDVDNEYIKTLSSSYEPSEIMKDLLKTKDAYVNNNKNDIIEEWKKQVNMDNIGKPEKETLFDRLFKK